MDQWESWFGIWDDEDVIFVAFVGNCYGFGICAPYGKPGVDHYCSGEEFSEHS